jgi:hypothetical protein
MGLTLRDPGLDGCNRAAGVALPPRQDGNEPCPCGSGSKYKRCCLERDEALRRQLRGAALPAWMETSRSKLRQFEKYVRNVFALPDLLANLTDKRRDPKISTFDVVNSLFHTAVLQRLGQAGVQLPLVAPTAGVTCMKELDGSINQPAAFCSAWQPASSGNFARRGWWHGWPPSGSA